MAVFTSNIVFVGYIFTMREPKKTRETTINCPSSDDVSSQQDNDSAVESIAERYLELWHDNIKYWATHPVADRKSDN